MHFERLELLLEISAASSQVARRRADIRVSEPRRHQVIGCARHPQHRGRRASEIMEVDALHPCPFTRRSSLAHFKIRIRDTCIYPNLSSFVLICHQLPSWTYV
jgi:hypothetical protein